MHTKINAQYISNMDNIPHCIHAREDKVQSFIETEVHTCARRVVCVCAKFQKYFINLITGTNCY